MISTKAKKNLISILLTALVVCAAVLIVFLCDPLSVYAEGDLGTQENPYIITTAEQLKQLAEDVEDGNVDGFSGSYFVLGNDIDLSEICDEQSEGWNPIGDYLCRFNGSFDGKGHTISNLYISRPNENYIGLFSILGEAAAVKNLTVCGTVVGKNNTGCIAGQNFGKIENCFSYASVLNVQAEMAMNVGGIVGFNDGVVSSCGNFGTVEGNLYYSGGVVGINNGIIKQSFNDAEVSSTIRYVGGVVGMNSEDAAVSESFNSGCIAVDGNYAGGIAGGNDGAIVATYNVGKISAKDYAGGICGNNSGEIEKSYNRSATIDGRVHKGAIDGNNTGTVSDCFNAKAVYTECVDCIGIDDFDMSLLNIITADGKMSALTNGTDPDVWIKREFDDDHWYLPELAFFGNNENANVVETSKSSTAVARIGVTAQSVDIDETHFIYDGTEHKPNVLFNGVVATENEIYVRRTTNGLNAGIENGASVVIEFVNFYKGNFTFNFTVTKKEAEVVWTEADFVYNGMVQMPTVAQVIGAVNDDVISFEYVGVRSVRSGKYEIEIVVSNANYSLKNASLTYEIAKRAVEIEGVSAVSKSYDGTNSINLVGGKLIGVIGDDNVEFVLGGGCATSENVGIHDVQTDIHLIGTDSDCYYLVRPQVSVEITKADFDSSVIQFLSKTFTYDGNEKSIYVESELPIGLEVEYEGNNKVNVGEYVVTARFIDEHGNYEPIRDIFATMYIAPSEFKDAAYDIIINVVEGFVDYGAELKIDNVEEFIDKSKFDKKERLISAYDISLTMDGHEVQPIGKLKISFGMGSNIKKAKGLTLLHKNGEIYEKVDFKIVDGCIVFYTDSLSVFVLTAKKQLPIAPAISLCILGLTVISAVLFVYRFRKTRTAVAELADGISTDRLSEDRMTNDSDGEFIIDGIKCASLESFKNSLCFKDKGKQEKICAMTAEKSSIYVRSKGVDKRRNFYWNGVTYKRNSTELKALIDRAIGLADV